MARTSPGIGPAIARFVGGTGGTFADPVSTATAPFALVGAGLTLTKNVLLNAAINTVAGAASEMSVEQWYRERGKQYTAGDFATNVSMGAAFGAALPLGGAAIVGTIRQARRGINFLKSRPNLSDDDKALIDILEDKLDLEESNPLEAPDPNAAQFEHESRLEAATIAINTNTAPNMPDEPTAPINAQAATEAQDVDTIYRVEAKNIEVDAKTFQFKSGGDEFGVTARLQGITKWEPQWAGVVTVYEYADGRVAIADGHQRVGLAKRIMANDPSQNIKLNAYKLREVDGISVEQARVIAALKNIVEGSGTAVDAAKVLRVDPSRLPDLPPMSELVQQARGIMPLSDNSFGMIVNGIVPPKYAMYVGRLIEDKGLQDAAMQVLAKSTPENKFQAEAMVRQVRDLPSDQVKQIDLFGEEFMTESYVFERGKILSKAYTELRRDKAAFETLVRNSERLEAEGNVLVTEANQRKATTDAQTIALLQTLANRKGPLSDALNEAARTARDTNNYGPATSGFLGAVRRSIDAGDFESVSTSDIGRVVDGSPEVSRPEVKEPDLDGFDEPTGVAADQQTDQLMVDMFGADEVAPAAPVRTLEEIEVDLKARQPVETVDEIYAIADESQSYIATIGAEIESDLGVIFKNPGLKDIDAAREKMQRKSYAASNQMTDISRGGFIINKAEDADAIVARFGRDAEILDEGWNFTPAGYFDRKILVRTPNGIVSEIQIWSPKVLAAKQKTGHKLYTKMRESKDPAEIESLSIQMRELYANALRSEDQSFRSLSGIDNLPKVASNADINAASSGITRPVSKTSGPSTGVQAPPGSSIATASVGEVEIAGRPSQLTNIIDDTSDFNLDIASANVNPDFEVPVGQRLNPDTDEVEIVSMSLRDLKGLMDEEDAMVRRLDFCTIGGNA
jgi:hypothetical protein